VDVTVRFHGIVGDMPRPKTQPLEIPNGATIADLLAAITAGDEDAQTILKQTRAFIDGKQADRAAPLSEDVEVIFMRPIAGGSGEVHPHSGVPGKPSRSGGVG
jgi:hypothetical protein